MPEDELRAFLLADKDDLYDAAIELPERRPALFVPESGARWVWRWTERAHAPRLRDERPGLASPWSPWGARVARERARLVQLDREELEAVAGGPRAASRTAVSTARRRALVRLERFHRRLELEQGRVRGGSERREPPIERLQSALGDDEVLLEYHVGRAAIRVVRVAQDAIDVVPLGANVDETRALVHRLRRLWDRFRLLPGTSPPGTMREAEADLLGGLHDRLVAPLLDGMRPDGIVIVPHRWLHGVPFHSLLGREGALVDTSAVRYGFTAAHALASTMSPATRESAVFIGVSSPEAPGAEDEARTLSDFWPGSTLLTGSRATQASLRRRWAKARLIHLAAHGDRHPDDPRSSGLRLHGSRFDVYDCDSVRTRGIVILSACRTGESVLWGSDDAFGLLPALVRSGANQVIASLWTVGDASAHRFMAALHAHLARGARVDRAMRFAYLAARASRATAFDWAPFALFGARGPGG